MKKRILIISYFSIPYNTPRAVQLHGIVERLKKSGYKVTVLTAKLSRPEDPTLKRALNIEKAYRHIQDFFELPILKNIIRKLRKKFNWKSYFELSFFWIAWSIIIGIRTEKPDYIISFSSPVDSHIVAYFLKKRWKCKWLAFFSDPYIIHGKYDSLPKEKPIYRKKILEKANSLIFPCDATAEAELRFEENYLWRKVHIIPHLIMGDIILRSSQEIRTLKKNNKDNKNMHIGHFGMFYLPNRSPENIIKAVGLLALPITLEFYGAEANLFPKMERLEYVKWHNERIPYADMLAMLKNIDILLLIDMNSIKSSHFLPSKLMDYLWARKPILALTMPNSETAKIVKMAGGWVADPNCVDNICDTISDIYNKFRLNGKNDYKQNQTFLEQFYPDSIVDKYQQLLN